MGATSAQGWYLFLFLVGFTLGPAGLFALGWPIALLGFAILAGAFAGFRSIKEPAPPAAENNGGAQAAPQLSARKSH